MKILVTGATGFLGSHLVPHLLWSGHEVFALTRSERSAAELRRLGTTPVIADLEGDDPIVLPKVDAVIHAAAYFRFAGPRGPYFKTNVDGTAALLSASRAAGAKRFVHVSAAGVIMDDRGSRTRRANESARPHTDSFSGYVASKARSEELVLAADRPGFRTIALRPPALWGPGDKFSVELPEALEQGRFAFIDRGDYAFSTCHVENLIEAIECALARGEGGQAYFVADRQTGTFREFVAMIATAHGASVEGVRSLPYRLAFLIGRAMEIFARLMGKTDDPPLSRSLVRMIGREFTVDDSAARRVLRYVGKVDRATGSKQYSLA
jgi:nucleoside-diphosphate-sugar epimerase